MTPIGPVARIQQTVADAFQLPAHIMREPGGREPSIMWPRQVAMYVARHKTNKSYRKIGELFGGLDHSTVHYAVSKVEKRIACDLADRAEVEALCDKVRA